MGDAMRFLLRQNKIAFFPIRQILNYLKRKSLASNPSHTVLQKMSLAGNSTMTYTKEDRMIRLILKGRLVFILMICLAFFQCLPIHSAYAAMVSTENIDNPSRAAEVRNMLVQVLAREEVRKHILAYGIDPEEAKARVACLTDAELEAIGERFDSLPPGGGGAITLPWYFFLIPLGILLTVIGLFAVLGYFASAESTEAPGAQKTGKPYAPSGGNIRQDHLQGKTSEEFESTKPAAGQEWAGKWKVEGFTYNGVWELKQDGARVTSAPQSFVELDGTVKENGLTGVVNQKNRFHLILSADGLTFAGDVGNRAVSGRRLR
jgi:hypothetical protein